MAGSLDTGVNVRRISKVTPGLTSRQLAFKDIPVIDLGRIDSAAKEDRAALAADLHRACTESGFFYVTNHGVPQTIVEQVLAASQAFFAQELEAKLEIDVSKSTFNRGYIPLYGEKNNEHAKGDIKETFDIAIEVDESDEDFLVGNPLYGPNQRPKNVTGFNTAIDAYFAEMTALCNRLYRAFALALGLPEDHFLGMVEKPLDILRLLHYPPQPVVADESQIGTGAHSDFDCFTVLWQDPVGGLQTLNTDDEWIDASPIGGTFLINVGDMLERWTNGRFVSTIHRVVNRSPNERYSVVFFAAPNYHAVVECLASCCPEGEAPQYPPVTAGDYIVERYEAILS